MLSQDQLEEFERAGLIGLRGAIPLDDVAAMRDRIWSFLRERDAVERDDMTSWPAGGVAGFQALRSALFDATGNAMVSAAFDDLIGKGRWGQGPCMPLVTFPQPGTVWTVPTSSWHLDAPPQMLGETTGVRLFIVLDDLGAHGGGTLVLAGSHRLVHRCIAASGGEVRSRSIKSALGSAHEWLAGLWGHTSSDSDATSRIQRLMCEGAIVDDVPVIVRELHGAPGDVFMMHADCFHASSANGLERPRIMAVSSAGRAR
jgi:hypothetical protein